MKSDIFSQPHKAVFPGFGGGGKGGGVIGMEKDGVADVSFDNLDKFLLYLKSIGKEDIEIEVIRCIAIHKSGIATNHANSYIGEFLERTDIGVIRDKLTLLCADNDYIYVCPKTRSYKFYYEKYDIINIPYEVDVSIKEVGAAVSGDARDSLTETMKSEQSCIYLFMAVTSKDFFEESLNNRIQQRRKTVVFFPHKKSVDIKVNSGYYANLNSWLEYLKEDRVKAFLDFYYINNKKYKYMYSSCLTENIVRYNYYEYRKDEKIHTGSGRVQVGQKDTSFYDIIKKEYENAFYERIPIGGYCKKEYFFSFLRRNLIKMLFAIFAIIAVIAFVKKEPDISSILVLATMIIGFLQNTINELMKSDKLFNGDNQ
jgi:hypothetical protein